MGNCSINISDGSELDLAWSKKSSSYFGNNFPIFLLSGISNTSVFKALDNIYRVHFLVIQIFSIIFCSTFYWAGNILYPIYFLLLLTSFIYIKSSFITITIKWCFCWYFWWRGFFSVFLLKLKSHNTYMFTSPLQKTLKQNHRTTGTVLKTCPKWFLKELLLEIEWSEAKLIWWFVSIKVGPSRSRKSLRN